MCKIILSGQRQYCCCDVGAQEGALRDDVRSCPDMVLPLCVLACCHGITEASVDCLMV